MLELTILIPCLNEGKTITTCIEKAQDFLEKEAVFGEILVVDNGSMDGTGEIAQKAGARVVTEMRQGYGRAILTGIWASKGKYVILGDGDDSYDFSSLMPLLEKLREGTDLVIGNRFQGGIEKKAMPFTHRYIGNPVLSFLGRVLYPCKARDFHCGLRGFHREKLAKLDFESTGMEFASEMIVKAKLAGYHIEEVPVKLYRDGRGGASHLRTIRDGFRHVGLLLRFRPVVSLIVTFLATFLVCLGLLTAVDTIPQKAMEEKVQESADYFVENELFAFLWSEHPFTLCDNYADCILTNIIYSMDTEHPFTGSVKASYYSREKTNVNESLAYAVQHGTPPNTDYFRYWHGSMVLLRPLFCVFSIVGVRLVLMGILVVLLLLTMLVLCRKKFYAPAAIMTIGLVAVQVWMCAFSVEYINSFLVMTVFLLGIALQAGKDVRRDTLDNRYIRWFMVSGMVTCFVDFLTTETVTLTMPLLLIWMLRLEKRELGTVKKEIGFAVKAALSWGISYSLMFAIKWGISSLVLGPESFSSAFGEAAYRVAGNVTDDNTNLGKVLGLGAQLSGTIWKNLQALFCLPDTVSSKAVYGIALGAGFVLFAIWYLLRRKNGTGGFCVLAFLLAWVPYLRFLALRNHSYMHFFFTYRAQAVTIAALTAIFYYGLRGLRKKRK